MRKTHVLARARRWGAGPPRDCGEIGARFPLVPRLDALDSIDVGIEMSGSLDSEWCKLFRARGGKIAFYNCGQPYAALIERSVFDRHGFFGDAERCDEVWLLSKDGQFGAMMRGMYRCPVHEAPYLWSPAFLEETSKKAEKEELRFGYRPGSLMSSPSAPAIFEPNISPIKMGIIPFMICEEVERGDPSAIGHVHLLNVKHMTSQHSFVFLVENSDLYKRNNLTPGERDHFSHVMARGANVVVSHQIDCAQNYLYLDAVAGATRSCTIRISSRTSAIIIPTRTSRPEPRSCCWRAASMIAI